jgi:hypothetical protein
MIDTRIYPRAFIEEVSEHTQLAARASALALNPCIR